MPSGFERNRKLCHALQFQTPLSEKLKDAGIPPKLTKVLKLAQDDPQFAEEFCRTWRKREITPPTPVGVGESLVEPNKMGGMNGLKGTKTPSGQREPAHIKELEETRTPSAPTAQARGEIGGADAASVQQKGERIPQADHLQTRVRVVAGTDGESTPESREMTETRMRIDKAGVAAVKVFEKQAGRSVTEMPHNHPGYDLESRGQSSEVLRYIEVKSTGSDWIGVLLSATQFQKAQELGEQYWLYVVENAESATPSVYPIQNPAGVTEKFIFDHGWKEISKALQQTSNSSP